MPRGVKICRERQRHFSYLLSGGSDLGLLGSPDLLHTVLALLLLFATALRYLLEGSLADQSK